MNWSGAASADASCSLTRSSRNDRCSRYVTTPETESPIAARSTKPIRRRVRSVKSSVLRRCAQRVADASDGVNERRAEADDIAAWIFAQPVSDWQQKPVEAIEALSKVSPNYPAGIYVKFSLAATAFQAARDREALAKAEPDRAKKDALVKQQAQFEKQAVEALKTMPALPRC